MGCQIAMPIFLPCCHPEVLPYDNSITAQISPFSKACNLCEQSILNSEGLKVTTIQKHSSNYKVQTTSTLQNVQRLMLTSLIA